MCVCVHAPANVLAQVSVFARMHAQVTACVYSCKSVCVFVDVCSGLECVLALQRSIIASDISPTAS